jgi:hypothetical protein
MSVLALWKSSPGLLEGKTAKQILAISGDGKLVEDGPTSQEIRALLAELPSSVVAKYALDCLEESFPDSGLVLQDIVNEMGARLGMRIAHGRYRGRPGVSGHDGLWTLPSGHRIVVEVKTTDAYRIDLNVIAAYRNSMIRAGETSEDDSSVLIVVGRIDTGDLEAQIRGSKYAWSMRLLSVDALVRLVKLRESLEDPESLRRIHQILVPREFTKLDEIVDLVFSTAEDAKGADEERGGATSVSAPTQAVDVEPKLTPVAFNDECAVRIGARLNAHLVKRSRALYSTADDSLRLVCAVSKAYDSSRPGYWFAFHPHQRDALLAAKAGYVGLGCGSPRLTLLIPISTFNQWLDGMNMTSLETRFYWHVQIHDESGRLVLVRRKGQAKIPLDEYKI